MGIDSLYVSIQNYSDKEGLDLVYYRLGELYFQQKMYKKSLENFQQILLQYPSSFYLEDARDKARALSELIKENDA